MTGMENALPYLDLGLLAAPFAAGLLVLLTHVPLGIDVLRRGIIFIDLAIAQIAALGVIAASLLGVEGVASQVAAGFSALFGAALMSWTERRWPALQEALIGLLFVLAAALGIVLLAGHPHGGEHLRDLLAGQILWVGHEQLVPVAVLYAIVLSILARMRARIGAHFGFYALFAVTVTASVQLVGVLLVFASLIAPAVATAALSGARRLRMAYGIGTAGYALGLLASWQADVPAGAAIVCALVVMALAGLLLLKR